MSKFIFYMIRWQLSTPILAVCLIALHELGSIASAVIANLIGGALFFFVDKLIFHSPSGQSGKGV